MERTKGSTSSAGRPRFLAYDAANGRMVMTGMDARQILNHIRDQLWPSADDRSIEIFDCGPGGVDAETIKLPVDETRKRFPAVFRGAGVPDLAPIALSNTL